MIFNNLKITTSHGKKKGRYRYTEKPYKRCIPVKNSHFYSYTDTYTDISVASSIYLYRLYNKKSLITTCIPQHFHIPNVYLISDIFKNRSDISGHFENDFYNITVYSRYMHKIAKILEPIYCNFIYMAQISKIEFIEFLDLIWNCFEFVAFFVQN